MGEDGAVGEEGDEGGSDNGDDEDDDATSTKDDIIKVLLLPLAVYT